MITKKEADLIFNTGKKSYGKILKIVSVSGTGEIIISAPIRVFKKAVDRNRIKRLVKEAIRKFDVSKINAFIIYNTNEIKSLQEIENDLSNLLKRKD